MRGEAWIGAARGARSAMIMTFGTGIGAGLLLDGRIYSGAHFGSGEIGLWRLSPPPQSGEWLSLEEIAAPGRIARRRGADFATLFAAWQGGDKETGLDSTFELAGRAIANAHLLLDLDVVVLSGAIVALGKSFGRAVEACFLDACPEDFRHGLRIRFCRARAARWRRSLVPRRVRFMNVVEAADYADLSLRAADIILAQIKAKPDSLLVLPTGRTPLGTFRALGAAHRRGDADFSLCRLAMLDEYVSIAPDDRRRLYHWIGRELIDPLGLPTTSVVAFDPMADPDLESRCVETAIAALGGIDLAVLGLGPNGHLGMNEPGSKFDSRTRLVTLAPESIRSNAAYWGSEADVPRQGMTLGLGTLSAARSILLLVSGAGKAGILETMLTGPISTDVPATTLRRHPACTIVADRPALRRAM